MPTVIVTGSVTQMGVVVVFFFFFFCQDPLGQSKAPCNTIDREIIPIGKLTSTEATEQKRNKKIKTTPIKMCLSTDD